MAAALDQVQAMLTGAYLAAEWFHGIGSPDPGRAMATWHPGRPQLHARHLAELLVQQGGVTKNVTAPG